MAAFVSEVEGDVSPDYHFTRITTKFAELGLSRIYINNDKDQAQSV